MLARQPTLLLLCSSALLVCCCAMAQSDVELCSERVSFLRANDMRCIRKTSCSADSDCFFESSSTVPCYTSFCHEGTCVPSFDPSCLEQLSTQQRAQMGTALDTLRLNDTTQCFGTVADDFEITCFEGLCGVGGCEELPGSPLENRFNCSCESRRYLACASNAECAVLDDEAQAGCQSSVCTDEGFCETRRALPPVPAGCCALASDCDDGEACTIDTCGEDGTCEHAPDLEREGCCSETSQCRGPPSTRPTCPSEVCGAGACLTAPEGPQCVGAEQCLDERYSYCAVETQFSPITDAYSCVGDEPLALMGRQCRIELDSGACQYGACTDIDGFAVCDPITSGDGDEPLTFQCDCTCGERVTTPLECGAPDSDSPYTCVPFGTSGGGGSGGASCDDGTVWYLLLLSFIGFIALGVLFVLAAPRLENWCRHRRAHKRHQCLVHGERTTDDEDDYNPVVVSTSSGPRRRSVPVQF